MSLFSWFSRKPAPPRPRPAGEPSGLLNADATVPLSPQQGRPLVAPAPVEHAANRKNERMERRELLYAVVRDAMVRAGVLSASYKFKVLSLDQRGRQFLVMMDLAREFGGETTRLSEIEALIAQTAKTRYDILVSAVYWRINDHVAVGLPQKVVPAPVQPAAAPVRRPLPAAASVAAAPATAATAAAGASPTGVRPPAAPVRPAVATPATPAPVAPAPAGAPRYDPIEADEVAAFKRALATTAGGGAAAAAKPGVAVRTGPLSPKAPAPTGFEDTEMPGADGPAPDLSSTQYGELN